MQVRVAASLVEKDLTTPDNYPLSMNALLAACNQSSNRHPVVHYDEPTVSNALLNLKAAGLARVVYSRGMRVDKYRHVLDEALDFKRRCNLGMVDLEPVVDTEDVEAIKDLLARHIRYTQSPVAARLLCKQKALRDGVRDSQHRRSGHARSLPHLTRFGCRL